MYAIRETPDGWAIVGPDGSMDSERYDGAGAAGHYAAMLNAAYSKGYGKGQQAVLLLLAPMAQAWKSVQSELDEIAKQVGQC